MKKNGVFLFVTSHLVPEIFKIFVLCKLGTDDIIRCDNMEVKTNSPIFQYLNFSFHRHFKFRLQGGIKSNNKKNRKDFTKNNSS